MDGIKRKKLRAVGWRTVSIKAFLQLSYEEAMLVEFRLDLVDAVKASRQKRGLSQIDLAQRMSSSASRVAKMESGDPSVSLDLMVRAFFASGGTRRELQRAFGAKDKLAA